MSLDSIARPTPSWQHRAQEDISLSSQFMPAEGDTLMRHKPPTFGKPSFSCPHCSAIAHQNWYTTFAATMGADSASMRAASLSVRLMSRGPLSAHAKYIELNTENVEGFEIPDLHASLCTSCSGISLWVNGDIVYPEYEINAIPDDEMPDDIKAIFMEASSIATLSPRGAAALLRLCIEKLCHHLGEKGTINEAIGNLAKNGLDSRIIRMLDVVRVLGNQAVHPGHIDANDGKATVDNLMSIVNIISNSMITQGAIINKLYEKIPESNKKAIERRDERK